MRPTQNGRYFPDDIFKCIFLNENVWISIKISLKCVPKGRVNNVPALLQIMAWRRPGDKPLSEPMMVSLPTHICVSRPQWVKHIQWFHITWNIFVTCWLWSTSKCKFSFQIANAVNDSQYVEKTVSFKMDDEISCALSALKNRYYYPGKCTFYCRHLWRIGPKRFPPVAHIRNLYSRT